MSYLNRPYIARNATDRDGSRPAQVQFLCLSTVLLAGLIAGFTALTGEITSPGLWGGVTVYVTAVLLALRGLRKYPHHSIGLCNSITLLRLALISGLIAAFMSPAVEHDAAPWVIFGVACFALALDGIDGWLARREGFTSDFGALFDVEIDALLALTLALHAYFGGHAGAFVIILGLPRYLFWAAQLAAPWLSAELPERFSRKVVCVLQIAVLIAVLLPVLEQPFTNVLAVFAGCALIWSFFVDIRWLSQESR